MVCFFATPERIPDILIIEIEKHFSFHYKTPKNNPKKIRDLESLIFLNKIF